MMALRVLSGAALLALANGQYNVQTEYQCKTQTKCINWDQFNDGITDCTQVGLYPIVTFQYSSTNLYQFSYHIQ